VERHLAKCLLTKNQAEIEISQFAQQQAQNPEVKQFAQDMVQEHQQLSQKLQPIAGMQAAAGRTQQPLSEARQSDAQRQASDTTRLPGSAGAGQQGLTAAGRPAGQQNAALNQLAEIDRQITDRVTQAVREQLQEKSGAEFDQCYLGYQVGNHTHMLAALEVIAQESEGQLRQVAQQAQSTVREHLDHAKQLMKEQSQPGQASSQAERQPARTQR
jgi:predicted outer membrane protein